VKTSAKSHFVVAEELLYVLTVVSKLRWGLRLGDFVMGGILAMFMDAFAFKSWRFFLRFLLQLYSRPIAFRHDVDRLL
jgi:hypothetical protein